MKYRTLGPEFEVSALGVGCMPMVGGGRISYGAASDDEGIATIHRAIELGVTLFDTAEVYGPYGNEELLGRALRGKRDGVAIATKFGFIGPDGSMGVNSTPANVRRACEESLKRLNVETIDLFYQHRVDPNVPIEETVGAMGELVAEGKGAASWAVGGGGGDDPARGVDASNCGLAERIFFMGARCRRGNPADVPRVGYRVRAL